jgi:CRISPR-associated exonuclease Cas4
VQLCAQVLCLEEMFGLTIETGQLYYLQEKRRSDVAIDKALREKTIALAARARELRDSEITPAAVYDKRACDNCSLVDICMPKSVGSGGKAVERFIQNQIRLMRENCEKEAE